MPKSTFKNLPVEKKQLITSIALKEFATHSFRAASLSRIVENAGIAKGSVYQYFENKKDFYNYLLEETAKKKLSHISEQLKPVENDYLQVLKTSLFEGALYDINNPAEALLLLNAQRESKDSTLIQQAAHFFQNYWNRNSGQKTDSLIVAHLSVSLASALTNYLEEKYGFTLIQLLVGSSSSLPFTEDDLCRAVDSLIEVFNSGLK